MIHILILLSCPLILISADHNIMDHGAVGDGITLNTIAIQTTIDLAHKEGTGRVIIPEGRFLTGSITLRSGVELHLEEGAVLLGSTIFEHHKKVEKSYMRAIIMASYQNDIAITGKGCIDGQGRATAIRTDSLFHSGALDMKYYNTIEGRPRFYMRPMLVVFLGCKKVLVSDVTMKNAASWVQHYDRCSDLTIRGIRVDSDAYWNNDGIDISDSKHVHVSNCKINAADDGICLKSHFDDEILENVVIEHLSLIHI